MESIFDDRWAVLCRGRDSNPPSDIRGWRITSGPGHVLFVLGPGAENASSLEIFKNLELAELWEVDGCEVEGVEWGLSSPTKNRYFESIVLYCIYPFL